MGGTIIGGSSSTGVPWTYIKTVETAAANDVDIVSLPAYDEYLITGKIWDGSTLGSGSLQINGDAGANYTGNYVASASVAQYSASTVANNVFCYTTISTSSLYIHLQGKTSAAAGGKLNGNAYVGCFEGPWSCFRWAGGNAQQVTRVYLKAASAQTFSSKLEIYGRMYK